MGLMMKKAIILTFLLCCYFIIKILFEYNIYVFFYVISSFENTEHFY